MKLFTLFFLLLMAACTSTQKKPSEIARQPYPSFQSPKPNQTSSVSEEEIRVDEVALQKWLGLSRNHNQLGYKEKSFNTCEAGFGYSKNHNCQQKHMVVINYRLQCRETEGTVSRALTAADIRDIASANVTWVLQNRQGISQTNGEGFGQIRGIFPSSQKTQRLRLGVGGELLYIRAGEITTVVTPGSWCQF